MTKERILEVAAKEFSKHGYSAVSMNNLVKIIDINKATIYYHYKDKKSLYQEVLKKSFNDAQMNINNLTEDITDSQDKFRAFIKSFLKTIQDKPHSVGLWMHEIANFGSNMDETLLPFVDEKITVLNNILKELPLKQDYKDINPHVIFSMIHGFIYSFYIVQMSTLAIGGDEKLKGNSKNTLEFMESFLANFILNAICEQGEK